MKISDLVLIRLEDNNTYSLIYKNLKIYNHFNLEYISALIGIYKPNLKQKIIIDNKELQEILLKIENISNDYDKNNIILDIKLAEEYKGFNALVQLSEYQNEINWIGTAIHPNHLKWFANFDANTYEESLEEMQISVDLILENLEI